MANRYWKGGTSGSECNFGTSTNWVDDSGNSGVPADGDTLIFGPMANNDAGVQYRCINSSGDSWDQSSKNFAAIYGLPGFTGGLGIGGSGSFIGLACGCDKLVWMAECDAFLIAKHASALFDDVQMCAASRTLYIARAATNGKATVTARCYDGVIHFVAPIAGQSDIINPDVDTLLEANGDTATIIVAIRKDLAANTITTLRAYDGGKIYTDHPFTNAYNYGGYFYYGEPDDSQCPNTAQSTGTVYNYFGDFYWYMRATLQMIYGYAGNIFVLGGLPKTLGDSSVNSGTIPLYAATLDLSQAGAKVTLGTDCEIQVLSPKATFKPQYGSQIVYTGV